MLGKELRAPHATKAALATMVLASLVACGGGGGGNSGSNTPFEVSVATTDTTVRAETLSAGETVTLEVAAGTRLTLKSDGETRWTPVNVDASYVVDSFSFNEKVVTVDSITGGEVAFSLSSKSSPEHSAVLKVKVSPHRFAAVKPNVGEVRTMKSTALQDGSEYTQTGTHEIIAVREDGSYDDQVTWVDSSFSWISTNTYDVNDNNLSYVVGDNKCTFTPAGTWVGAPMYFGKSWVSESQVVCDGYSYSLKVTGKIDGYAEVSVPAGKYRALRLQQTEVSTYSDSASPTGKNVWTSQNVCWWATEIGRLIKCDDTISAELPSETVSFSSKDEMQSFKP